MSEERKQYLLSREELTIREAAELWGVNYQRVWRYIQTNLLEGRNTAPMGAIFGRWVVKTDSLKKRMGIEDTTGSEPVKV